MGSSKKHKDKDREHKRKRKHRSRSRSRSRSRERHKHKDESKRKRRDYEEEERPIKEEIDEKPSGGGDLELSIEETNRLRAKLGLKPLEGIPGLDGLIPPTEEKESLKDDIHVPAVSVTQVKKTNDIKEKLALMKQKREMNKKLGKVKTLGESDDDDELSVAAKWVKKSRQLEKDKKMASQRAKMLEEMDEEFGISDLVEEEFGKQKKPQYSSKDLRGLQVLHDVESFKEGQRVILTLKDKGVLDDDSEDVLENVNMVDFEKAKKNVENKLKRPDYKPYDDGELDEYGMMKLPNMLSKYDEEIEGAKKEKFELGSGGQYDSKHEKAMQEIRRKLKQQGQSLQMSVPKIASEYYTQEEMSFKKVKNKSKKKIRKKVKPLTADDLLQIAQDGDQRNSSERAPGEPVRSEWGTAFVTGLGDTAMDPNVSQEDIDIMGPTEDLTGVLIDDDDAQDELQKALDKTRKLKSIKEVTNTDEIAMKVLAEKHKMEDDEADIVLNSMSEFCRTVGDIPTYGLSGNREEERDEILDMELELLTERKLREENEEGMDGWQEVEITEEAPVDIRDEEKGVLNDEPALTSGLGAALQLAKTKGFLEQETKKIPGSKIHTSLMAKNYMVEDKSYNDIDEKYKKRDRFSSGITMDFKEKQGYKPDVKLEYVDQKGYALNQKEAFRQLSHRFHGKGSGKKKTEKRAKKIEEELLLLQMSSTDTPLNTVALLQQKQQQEKTPYIVLTGGGKTLSSGGITKTS